MYEEQNPFAEEDEKIQQAHEEFKDNKHNGLTAKTKMLLIIMLICFTVLLMIWSAWAFGFTSGRDVGLEFCLEQSQFIKDNAWRLA